MTARRPSGTRRSPGQLRAGLPRVPGDEVADDLRGSADTTALRIGTGDKERLPETVRHADVPLSLTLADHASSLAGGIPVSLENPLRVGSHPANINAMVSGQESLTREQLLVLDRTAYFGTPGYTDPCRSMPGHTYARALRRLEDLGLIREVSRGSREITEAGLMVLNAGVLAA